MVSSADIIQLYHFNNKGEVEHIPACTSWSERCSLYIARSRFSRFIAHSCWSDRAWSRILLLWTNSAPVIQHLLKFHFEFGTNATSKLGHKPLACLDLRVTIKPRDSLALLVHVYLPFRDGSIH